MKSKLHTIVVSALLALSISSPVLSSPSSDGQLVSVQVEQREHDDAMVVAWANTSTAEEIQRVKGIGPVKAAAIIAARQFESIEDLDAVKGIGPVTLQAIRDHITKG